MLEMDPMGYIQSGGSRRAMNPPVNSMSLPEAVDYYESMGMCPHPLSRPDDHGNSPGKRPLLEDWSNYKRLTDRDKIKHFKNNMCNIGNVCGQVSDVTVIDRDFICRGIWDYIFEGFDTTDFVIQSRTTGRDHLWFHYSSIIDSQKHHALGFEVLNNGSNVVIAPSEHVSGAKYQFNKNPTERPHLPEQAVVRIKEVTKTWSSLESKVNKCRPTFQKFFKAYFIDNQKSNPRFRDMSVFHGSTGRDLSLHLFAELARNGASEQELDLLCMLIFLDRYDKKTSLYQISKINQNATATSESIEAHPVLSQFYDKGQRDYNETVEAGQPVSEVIEEATISEIAGIAEHHRDLRLTAAFPDGHYINDFVAWQKSQTDGFQEYMILAALANLSAVTLGKVQLRLKQGPIKPNLYIQLIGESTSSRKSTITNKARHIYESATWASVPNSDHSIEGLIEDLSRDPVRFFIRDESGGQMAKDHKKYNEGIVDLWCSLYDCQNYTKTLAAGRQKTPKTFSISGPYITRLQATTPDTFFRYMTVEDFLSGLGFRFLFAYPTYKKERLPFGMETKEDMDAWTSVMVRTKSLYNQFAGSSGFSFTITEEALEYYNHVVNSLEEQADAQNNGMFNSVVGRSQAHILKIAMLIEIGKATLSKVITLEAVQLASQMVTEYFIPTIMLVIDRLQEDAKNNKLERIVAVLRRLGGYASHTKLLHDTKMLVREFNECIETLIESGAVQARKETNSKTKFYILTERGQNPPSPKNPRNLQLSNVEINAEILETSNKLIKCAPTHIDTQTTHYNNSLTLQNLQHDCSVREPGIREIFGISEISHASKESGQGEAQNGQGLVRVEKSDFSDTSDDNGNFGQGLGAINNKKIPYSPAMVDEEKGDKIDRIEDSTLTTLTKDREHVPRAGNGQKDTLTKTPVTLTKITELMIFHASGEKYKGVVNSGRLRDFTFEFKSKYSEHLQDYTYKDIEDIAAKVFSLSHLKAEKTELGTIPVCVDCGSSPAPNKSILMNGQTEHRCHECYQKYANRAVKHPDQPEPVEVPL